jgi:hypothetical protein
LQSDAQRGHPSSDVECLLPQPITVGMHLRRSAFLAVVIALLGAPADAGDRRAEVKQRIRLR